MFTCTFYYIFAWNFYKYTFTGIVVVSVHTAHGKYKDGTVAAAVKRVKQQDRATDASEVRVMLESQLGIIFYMYETYCKWKIFLLWWRNWS